MANIIDVNIWKYGNKELPHEVIKYLEEIDFPFTNYSNPLHFPSGITKLVKDIHPNIEFEPKNIVNIHSGSRMMPDIIDKLPTLDDMLMMSYSSEGDFYGHIWILGNKDAKWEVLNEYDDPNPRI